MEYSVEHRPQDSPHNNKSQLLDSNENDRLVYFLQRIRKIDDDIPTLLTTSDSSINNLRRDYPDFIEVKESKVISSNLSEYNVAYKFDLNLADLQNIAWETSKMSNITSELDYDCLQDLVKIYSLQEIFLVEQQKILNHFVNAEHDKLLSVLLIVQQLKSQLLNVISEGQEKMKNCK